METIEEKTERESIISRTLSCGEILENYLPVIFLDHNLCIERVSQRIPETLGYEAEELQGRNLIFILKDGNVLKAIEFCERPVLREVVIICKGGGEKAFDIFVGGNQESEIILALHEVTDYTKRSQLMEFDALTGLHRYTTFRKMVDAQIGRINQSEKKTKAALFFFDLDNTKFFNDVLGHLEGDLAIRQMGEIIAKSFKGSDIVCRRGDRSDEYLVFSLRVDEAIANKILARVQENFSKVNSTRGHPLSVTGGFAVFDPEIPVSFDELEKVADAAMYSEKDRKYPERRKREKELKKRKSAGRQQKHLQI